MLSNLSNYPNTITWYINNNCNFRCFYCPVIEDNKKPLADINLDILSESLDYVGKDWRFFITGGEPFFEKNFIDIAKIISEKQILGGILTNLALADVHAFADKIDPDKCGFFDVSIHITEREKSKDGLKKMIDKVLFLQKENYSVKTTYVAHPKLLNRMKADIDYIQQQGVETVLVKSFGGNHNNKVYPESYSLEEKDLLASFEMENVEKILLNSKPTVYGRKCTAGYNFFVMDRDGNLQRCSSSPEKRGNLFEKTVVFDKKPKVCRLDSYFCSHDCIFRSIPTMQEKIKSKLGFYK